MKKHPHNASLGSRYLLCLLLLLATKGLLLAEDSKNLAVRPPLVVVSDDNYPPYIFREESGKLRGILPDQWALWEQKTGIKVDLRAMDWSKAQLFMDAGHADVIDSIFFNEERAKRFTFSPHYANIKVPVFAHKALGGISDAASLKGFTIGVKTGDNVVDDLRRRGIESLKEYPSYEAIVLAAKKQEIKVFSVDEPSAVYYLYKFGIANDFRQCFILYTGTMHRAVRKGREDLIQLVLDGFGKISAAEYRAIDRRWMGTPFLFRDFIQQGMPWLLGLIAAIMALAAGNILLVKRVHAKTAELRTALEELQNSLAERQKSEESLRTSREYFATVFNASNDGLFIHDPTTFQILDVNQRTQEMYGFDSRERAITSLFNSSEDLPPFSLLDAEAWLRKARDEGPQRFEWSARHRDGHRFWTEIDIRKVRIGPKDRLIVAVRDISERKKTQAALQENNDLFQQFMRHSPIYVFIKEVTANSSLVVLASENFKDMTGVPASQMQGRTMEELFPAEFASRITADDQAVVSKGVVLKLDEKLNGRHYTTIKFPIVRGGKTLLAGYTIDITDRKRAEQALALTLERYNLLAKLNRIVTWEIDCSGLYTHLSDEVFESTAMRPDDMIGKRYFYEVHPKAGREAFKKSVLDLVGRGEPIGDLIHPVLTPERGIAWFSSSGIPTRDNQGHIQGYWGTSTDITDRKRAEEETSALQEKLMHAQKLESVGRLAGGVAHDFNNMLQAILSYVEMALEQVSPGQPIRDDLLEIQKAAQRSAKLTRQLQTFARKQAMAPKPLDINDAVSGMSDMLRRLIGKDIALEWKPGRGVGSVMIDPGQFDQILVNLCINARDAIEQSGSIAIETDLVNTTRAIGDKFAGIPPGSYVLLSVRDTGAGMSQAILDRIFEPFFTTKLPGQGTGLGLSIVYGIVTQNGGHVRAESGLGKGSVFQVYLPACAPEHAGQASAVEARAPEAAASETILLVDDEESVLRPTRKALEGMGYRVLATASPKDAIRLFEERPERIDLLITDVVMPDMNGPDMVKVLLKRRPDLKHLFISGHTANLLTGKELSEFSTNCIQKPFSRAILAAKVHEVLASHTGVH